MSSPKVTVDASGCVVITQDRANGDQVVITVTDVQRTVNDLLAAQLEIATSEGRKLPNQWPRRGIHRLAPGSWMVPSTGSPGAFRHVRYGYTPQLGSHMLCSCPWGERHGPMGGPHEPPCRHVKEVDLAERDDGYPPRPTGTVNPSHFVD